MQARSRSRRTASRGTAASSTRVRLRRRGNGWRPRSARAPSASQWTTFVCSAFFPDMLDTTHDPALRSWVDSANDAATDFPIQNLPFGVFRRAGEDARVGVAIGDQILDLRAASLLDASNLNVLMAQGRDAVQALRRTISDLLRAGAPPMPRVLVPMDDVEMLLPASIGDYSDFYASMHHATNVGSMFRPDNPLLPNY